MGTGSHHCRMLAAPATGLAYAAGTAAIGAVAATAGALGRADAKYNMSGKAAAAVATTYVKVGTAHTWRHSTA